MQTLSKIAGLLLIMLFFAESLTAQDITDPVEYNDYIINEQLAIHEKMQSWMDAIKEEKGKEEVFDELDEIVDQVNNSVKKLQKLGDFEGNTEFRDAGIALFKFYARIFQNEYKEMTELMYGDIGEKEKARMNELVELVGKEEKKYDEKFLGAQERFAKKYNIKLNKN